MEVDFGLLILAHLLGDYIFQNDWMANGKTKAHLPCLVHVTLYTLAFFVILTVSGTTWPLWAYAAIWLTHYPMDRYRLAAKWMQFSGQQSFSKHLAPWSVIIVDNTYHLLCAWGVWLLVRS